MRLLLPCLLVASLFVSSAMVTPSRAQDQDSAAPTNDALTTPKVHETAPGKTDPADTTVQQDRETVLRELYKSLAEAETPEDAVAVEALFDRFWEKSGSDTVDLLLSRAIELQDTDAVDDALDILDTVTELDPTFAEGFNRRAYIFFQNGDYRRALIDLQKVLTIDPKHFRAIGGLAIILNEAGDEEAALKAFRQLLEVHPHHAGAKEAVEDLAPKVEGRGI